MSCTVEINGCEHEILISLDPTNLFRDENLQYKTLRQIRCDNLKLYRQTLANGLEQYNSKSKNFSATTEEHINTLELMLEALNNIIKSIDSNQKQMKRIEPVILSNLMAIGMNYYVIDDNGVGARFCFNPKEKCRNYMRNDLQHCGRFHHFDRNLCEILKAVVSYTINNLDI